MELENEELKQKIKILEEENARLHGELQTSKVNELSATTPPSQMFPPTHEGRSPECVGGSAPALCTSTEPPITQKMDREKENNKNGTCCFFICCTDDNRNRNMTNNRDCCCGGCCCCCVDGDGCEGGCDD